MSYYGTTSKPPVRCVRYCIIELSYGIKFTKFGSGLAKCFQSNISAASELKVDASLCATNQRKKKTMCPHMQGITVALLCISLCLNT